ncbi:hva22 tb2 dp1 family protein [Moniliophthora roreri]|nr:hva22 tb2 dp1 family protein [Moniliophthora roreri]
MGVGQAIRLVRFRRELTHLASSIYTSTSTRSSTSSESSDTIPIPCPVSKASSHAQLRPFSKRTTSQFSASTLPSPPIQGRRLAIPFLSYFLLFHLRRRKRKARFSTVALATI